MKLPNNANESLSILKKAYWNKKTEGKVRKAIYYPNADVLEIINAFNGFVDEDETVVGGKTVVWVPKEFCFEACEPISCGDKEDDKLPTRPILGDLFNDSERLRYYHTAKLVCIYYTPDSDDYPIGIIEYQGSGVPHAMTIACKARFKLTDAEGAV